MHHLSIDLETYSSVPIAKAGAQKYISSPDFEILLFAYSVDGAPVEIIDLARGERLPPWLVQAITSPEYIKHAYNAPFEWGCLSKFLGTLPPDQWRCTMFHGLYCGYTAGLDATGKALGLAEDKRKLNTGKALIRYFCVPCAPTKANGGRTRNLPQHDTDKWELFKEYCRQDVVTEMEIERRLSAFPVPDFVQKQWETDLIINARGVAVDMELVSGALYLGNVTRQNLTQEAMKISKLDNPNSVAQLTQWLQEAMGEELADLRKDTVARLLGKEDNSPQVQRMLEIRQELGKTSTKKYDAIVNNKEAVAFLIQYHGETKAGDARGQLLTEPIKTIDTSNRYGLVTAFVTKFYKTGTGQSCREPLHTITTSPGHFGLVSAFLIKYYGTGCGQTLEEPLATITTKDRFGLVNVVVELDGEKYILKDIFLRMLKAEPELKLMQGFPADYIITHDYDGKPYPIKEQVARIGNSVVPIMAKALVQANCPHLIKEAMTA